MGSDRNTGPVEVAFWKILGARRKEGYRKHHLAFGIRLKGKPVKS
jgi:hypothetical protein